MAADDGLIEGRDYELLPDGRLVFTAAFLLRRGECCRSGCRNCPYGFGKEKPASEPAEKADDQHT